MKPKIYYINRYSSPNWNEVRNHSGYEQLVKYSEVFKSVKSSKWLSRLIFAFLKTEKPEGYRESKSSEELILFFKALITGNPVFYLYADKDAFILPLLKRKFKIGRLKLFGTLHWPVEISQGFSFYRHNLADQFNGIITLSSSLNPVGSTRKCVIPHGINLEYWKNDTPLDYKNSYLILGISNRDHLGQIEIINRIKKIDPTARFTLLMQDEAVYKQYESIAEMEIIHTRVSDDDLKGLYLKSKAVILIQNHCLASNVVLECISMAVPLLVNRVGDIEDYLGPEYPLYLEEAEEDDKLNKICNFPDFRNGVVNYVSQIRNQFEWKAIAERTVNFIEHGC